MGNEVSRLSPQDSGVVPPRSPYTPTGGAARRVQSFNMQPPPLSVSSGDPSPSQRRTSSSSSLGSNPKKERTIQRMDKAIRRRVRGGITYNMKLLIRGAKGTGKTSLFQRLKGEPIPETHESTPQLQSATIKWNFRQNLEENVKCEVWDVVDRGFVPVNAVNGEEGAIRSENAAAVDQGGLQSWKSLPPGATAAAAAVQNGTHSMAIVDASNVNVYHEAHGVIFLLDITKWDTLEYVKQQLDNVPVNIPTLVLGSFRDQGAQRKIFKEDIQELLYGSSDQPRHQQWRRPMELLYFECSLLNCYGLKSLHQYFGIPFLQLKLATIRQQMRIVEGEFTHLKRDVQATITEQRYAEYVEHIKTTGSDIRTGRHSSGIPSSNGIGQGKPATQQDDADNGSKENGAGTPPTALTTETSQQEEEVTEYQKDMEDLPARNSSTVVQAAPTLKFEDKKSMTSISDDNNVSKFGGKHVLSNGESSEFPVVSNASPSRPRKTLVEEAIHLEDFQVPKTRTSDLDHFYSEDESDEEIGGNDEDVVVATADGSMKANISGACHKQRFLDSDSSDLDESESTGIQRRRKDKAPHESPPHRRATKQANATIDQTKLRLYQFSLPSPSSHSPPTASPLMQKSRPGSPVRPQPSSPIKDAQGAPCEEPLKQRQSFGRTSDVALTPTHSAVPPTSASALLSRQSSPRSKNENSCSETNSETRVSVSQDEGELKNKSSSSDECEFTGRENSSSPSGQVSLQRSLEHESLMNLSDGTYSAANDANDNAVITNTASHATKNTEMSASVTSMQNALDNGANSEPEDDPHSPAHNQKNNSIEKEIKGGSADAGMNGLSVDELSTILGHDDKAGYNDKEAATSQATEDADMPHDSVSPNPPHRHPVVRMSDDENDGGTSDLTGPTILPLSSLKGFLSISETLGPSTLLNDEGTISLSSQGLEDTMGHYHKRNLHEAGDFLSLSALQVSLPLPSEAASPLPSILCESTKGRMGFSNGVSDVKTNIALQLSDFQTMPSEALVSKPVVPDFATVVPSHDLEAFLNENESDSEGASPQNYVDLPGGNKQLTKQRQMNRRVMTESSDDGEKEGDEDRFASYIISKRNRSERRHQQKEDLRQLNAALNLRNDSFSSSTSAVAATDSSFGTSGVMEAIRKAQEDAMRMLPADPASTVVRADSSLSKKRRTLKHKKEHKKEDEDGSKKGSKKCSRKSGLSLRSKKRRPHVKEDIA